MRKFFLIVAAISIAVVPPSMAIAQGEMAGGFGVEVAVPMGNFGDVADMGFGGTATFYYDYKPGITLMGHAGYITWGGKSDVAFLSDISYSAIPIQGGAKYYWNEGTNRPYAGGLAGFHFFSWEWNYQLFGNPTSVSESEIKISLAPMVGYEMKVGEKMIADFSARYQYVSGNLSYLAVRAGLLFSL